LNVSEPCIRAAAVLTSHWLANDIEAVVLLLNEVSTMEEAVDLVTGMLLTRKLPPETITAIVRSPFGEEAS